MEYDADKPDVRTELERGFYRQAREQLEAWRSRSGAFDRAVVVDETYVTPVETHNPMEMHGTVAVWDGDNLTLYESSQGVVNHRTVMSEVLGVPRENVRVISRFIGSGFGGKLSPWPQGDPGRGRGSPAEPARETQRRSAHDVLQRRPSPAHAAAHPSGRDAGWQTHRDSPRFSSETSQLDEFMEHCGEQTPFLYSCPNLEVTTAWCDATWAHLRRCAALAPCRASSRWNRQ